MEDEKLTNELDNELDDDDNVSLDEMVASTMSETGSTLQEISEELEDLPKSMLLQSIRRLFLANKIKKFRVGKQIFFKKSTAEEEMLYNNNDEAEDDEQTPDSKNISRLARKFRSCRYIVKRNYSTDNGLLYSLMVEKKGIQYYIMYFSSFSGDDNIVFSKMLENDKDIRIVAADNRTKIEIAKTFDAYVKKNGGLDEFNKDHAFLILTMSQFFQKTRWKMLV